MTTKTAEQVVQEIKEHLKGDYEEMKGRMDASDKLTDEFKSDVDERLKTMNEKMAELEQKTARATDEDAPSQKSLGQSFVESELYQKSGGSNLQQGNGILVEVKNITSHQNSAGALIHGVHASGVHQIPEEKLLIRDLFGYEKITNSNSYIYDEERGFVNNAKGKEEGEVWDESNITYEEVTVPIKAIGHHIRVSKYALDDAPRLQSLIDGRLRYGTNLAIDRQLLNGDGLQGNLRGVMITASNFAEPSSRPTYTKIDQLMLALLQANYANYPTDGIVLNPIDWGYLQLDKDAEERYIIGNPSGAIAPTLWSTKVVESHSMQIDNFLTGAFKMGGVVVSREEMAIDVGYVDKDFLQDRVRIKAVERLALAVIRPEAFVKGKLKAKV